MPRLKQRFCVVPMRLAERTRHRRASYDGPPTELRRSSVRPAADARHGPQQQHEQRADQDRAERDGDHRDGAQPVIASARVPRAHHRARELAPIALAHLPPGAAVHPAPRRRAHHSAPVTAVAAAHHARALGHDPDAPSAPQPAKLRPINSCIAVGVLGAGRPGHALVHRLTARVASRPSDPSRTRRSAQTGRPIGPGSSPGRSATARPPSGLQLRHRPATPPPAPQRLLAQPTSRRAKQGDERNMAHHATSVELRRHRRKRRTTSRDNYGTTPDRHRTTRRQRPPTTASIRATQRHL